MTLLDALKFARLVIAAVAGSTESQIDDNLVKVLDWLIENPQIAEWLRTIGFGAFEGAKVESLAVPAKLVDFAAREKIDWKKLLPVLLTIAKIIAGL